MNLYFRRLFYRLFYSKKVSTLDKLGGITVKPNQVAIFSGGTKYLCLGKGLFLQLMEKEFVEKYRRHEHVYILQKCRTYQEIMKETQK